MAVIENEWKQFAFDAVYAMLPKDRKVARQKPKGPREMQVAILSAIGYGRREIAEILDINHKTVARHRHNIFNRTHLNCPVGLASVLIYTEVISTDVWMKCVYARINGEEIAVDKKLNILINGEPVHVQE